MNFATGCDDVKCTSDSGFASAVTAAKNSDFVVYVGGISKTIEGEGNDRSNISLPGLQSDLISMYVCAGVNTGRGNQPQYNVKLLNLRNFNQHNSIFDKLCRC